MVNGTTPWRHATRGHESEQLLAYKALACRAMSPNTSLERDARYARAPQLVTLGSYPKWKKLLFLATGEERMGHAQGEALKAIVQRYYGEVILKGNFVVLEEVVAKEIVAHGPGFPDLKGYAAFLHSVQSFRTAFPDVQGTLEDVRAEGDRVGVRWTEQGTHQGEYAGIAATGKAMQWTGISIYRLAEGKVVEMWVQMDHLGLWRQLGVIPN